MDLQPRRGVARRRRRGARARLAKRINVPIAICDKRREKAGESEVMNVIGDVSGKRCVLIDDIVDSGGTLVNAANALLEQGATEVDGLHHPRRALRRRGRQDHASSLKTLVITDSIQPTEPVKAAGNIRVLSIAPLLAEAIARTRARRASRACSIRSACRTASHEPHAPCPLCEH
jgi:ribose-phosphate pyrophosphokinase